MKQLTRLILFVAVPLLTASALFLLGFSVSRLLSPSNRPPLTADTISVRTDSVIDTLVIHVRDTVPQLRHERILGYVPVPSIAASVAPSAPVPSSAPSTPAAVPVASPTGSSPDSLPVVQRQYSDDSTYTAYVSGLRYMDYPRLDSLTVMHRTLTRTLTKTVTVQTVPSRITVGIVGGYGIGIGSRTFEPFVGVGISYRLFPP